MPIFEYECEKCGRFDVLQLAGDKTIKFCPTCEKKKKKTKVTKVLSSPAFHLKGTGWYKTDYASGNSAADKKAKKGSASSETKDSDTKDSDTKNSEAKNSENKNSDNNGDTSSENAPVESAPKVKPGKDNKKSSSNSNKEAV